jgi:hypothetical protein
MGRGTGAADDQVAFGVPKDDIRDRVGNVVTPLGPPVAVFPSTVHGLMRAQKACFTLHGTDHRDLRAIVEANGWPAGRLLVEFEIPASRKPALVEDLALAGTTASTIFPDLEGLASDLTFQFRIQPTEG